jgi:hypothetical protein
MALKNPTTLIEGFTVRLVAKGDAYGRESCVTHQEDDPLVEFYDAKQDKGRFGPHGQFVSRYYCGTILANDYPQGLNLQGGVWEWSISPLGMKAVVAHILSNGIRAARTA